jgi:beta-mannanase
MFYGAGSIQATSRLIGATPTVHLAYFGWTDDWATARSTRHDYASHRIPMVNWEPFGVNFRDIVVGRYDSMLSARADETRQLPGQFFLDFAAEMNEEEGWGNHNPALYRAAWRHIHNIFTAHGASNAVWVWAPNNTDSAGEPPALAYYPGKKYVDWTGIDGYNWGTSTTDFDWQTFRQVFEPMYVKLRSFGKPVIIGETGSDEVGGSKAQWIVDIVAQLQTHFTDVRAVVWFDVDKERHWQIASSPTSLAAFKALAGNSYFRQ